MAATRALDLVAHPFLQAVCVKFVVAWRQDYFILDYLLFEFAFRLQLRRQAT